MSPLIAPSMLACDFANIERDVKMINDSEADWFHLDVMDGRFVPNISFGIPVIKSIAKHATKDLDVHLMIVEPEKYVSAFVDAGADVLTVHYEASVHLHRTLGLIRSKGVKAGVALNPHTEVSLLKNLLHEIDVVCIMSVNPGFGGQSFIEGTYAKVEELKGYITAAGASTLIEIDGGVGPNNAAQLCQAGADVLVSGSAVFKTPDPKATIAYLKGVNSVTT